MLNHCARPLKNLFGVFIFAATTSLAIATPILEKPTADDNYIKVSNSTTNALSFSVNKSCSSRIGTIKAYSVEIISQATLMIACQTSPHNCDAIVYPTEKCNGNPI